jgi:ADP-heptose:LPS heptosyltransferase
MKIAELKKDPDRVYRFKSRFKAFLARSVDAIGFLFFRPKASQVDWGRIRKIAVLRLDHLGDVLMALPAVRALEKALPEAQVDLFIGPWAERVVEIAGLRARIQKVEVGWFSRSSARMGTRASIKELRNRLRAGGYDAVVELRGDSRQILALVGSGIRERIGLARSGLGFLLNHLCEFHRGLHETDRNFDVIQQAGIGLTPPTPGESNLFPREQDHQEALKVRGKLGISGPLIAIHATGSTQAKRWPASNWSKLIDALPAGIEVVLIGVESERQELEEIRLGSARRVFSAAGLLDLPALAAFLKDCRLLIGVDSGPAHIAAAVGTPVISLFSGTNVAAQWAPRGSRVEVIQKVIECSPCELTECPIGNECMRRIEVEEVLDRAKKLILVDRV